MVPIWSRPGGVSAEEASYPGSSDKGLHTPQFRAALGLNFSDGAPLGAPYRRQYHTSPLLPAQVFTSSSDTIPIFIWSKP